MTSVLQLGGVGVFGWMLKPAARHLSKPDSPATIVRVHDRGKTGTSHDAIRQTWRDHGAMLVSDFASLAGEGDLDGVLVCAGKNGDDRDIFRELVPLLEPKTAKRPVVVHMSTVSPGFSRAAYAYCDRYNIDYVAAPLTGGPAGAESATMLILTCGSRKVIDLLQPTLEFLGKPKYFGEDIGAGAAVKLIGHLMVGGGLWGVTSAASLHTSIFQSGTLGGGEQTAFFDFLNGGAGSTAQWPRALRMGVDEAQFEKGFLIKHAVVDMVYLADLLHQRGQSLLSIIPVLNLVLGFAYILHHFNPSVQFATHALVQAMLNERKDEVNLFVRKHLDLSNTQAAIDGCIDALPPAIKESVLLDVNFND